MEPIEYVQTLIRRWPIIFIGALIGAAYAFFATDAKPEPVVRTYTATHTLLVTDTSQSGVQSTVGGVTFSQVPVFATTGEVPQRVAAKLGYDGAPASLAAEVTVAGDQATGALTFTTEQDDPDQAVQIADAFADETVTYLAERQEEVRQDRLSNALADVQALEAEIDGLDQQIAGQLSERNAGRAPGDPPAEADAILTAQRDSLVLEYTTAYEGYRSLGRRETAELNLTTLERAQPVEQQTGGFTPPRTRATRVPIAAAIGAALGAAVALLVDRLDTRIRDRRKAEEALGYDVVAELPTLPRKHRAARLVVAPDQHHAAAEAFRSLHTAVAFLAAGDGSPIDADHIGLVVVTSPSPGDGKTTVAINLAAAFAETGREVVIVNADFRRPAVSRALTDDRMPPPASLEGIDRIDPTRFLEPTRVPGVRLLDLAPLGGSTSRQLPRATVRVASALADRVDVVVVDTSPLSVTAEALEFVPIARVVLLLGRIGRTTVTEARRAGELTRFSGPRQVGAVLTNVAPSLGRRKRYYYEYYGGRRRDRAAATDVVVAPDGDARRHLRRPNGEREAVLPDIDAADERSR